MTSQIDFAAALREVRESKGHSQHDLAYNLGCDTMTVSRWERGKHRVSRIFRRQLLRIYPELGQQAAA